MTPPASHALTAIASGVVFLALGFTLGHRLNVTEAQRDGARGIATVAAFRAEALTVASQIGPVCFSAVDAVPVRLATTDTLTGGSE